MMACRQYAGFEDVYKRQSRGILGAVQNALTGEVVNNPLPPQPKPAATLVVEEFTAPSIYLDGIYTL